jgi:hypothetical protein
MQKDISFLIPTNRGQEFIQNTINSINDLNFNNLTYEICIYSPTEIIGKNVKWFPEDKPMGPIYGYNYMAYNTDSKYISVLTDNVMIPNRDAIQLIMECFSSEIMKNKKIKITGFSNGGGLWGTPAKNSRMGSLLKIPFDLPVFPVAAFPFVERETFNTYLCKHIWHPEFRYHGCDTWLGWWLGFMGEPFFAVMGAHLLDAKSHKKNHNFEIIDCNTAFCLLLNFIGSGFSEYILPEHSVYNKSTIHPRAEIV